MVCCKMRLKSFKDFKAHLSYVENVCLPVLTHSSFERAYFALPQTCSLFIAYIINGAVISYIFLTSNLNTERCNLKDPHDSTARKDTDHKVNSRFSSTYLAMSATPEETSPVPTVSSETYQQRDRTSSETPAPEVTMEKSPTSRSSVATDRRSSRDSSSSMNARETPLSPESGSVYRKLKRKLEKLESGEEKPTDKKVKTWEERLETDALYYYRVEGKGVSRHDPVSPWGTDAGK